MGASQCLPCFEGTRMPRSRSQLKAIAPDEKQIKFERADTEASTSLGATSATPETTTPVESDVEEGQKSDATTPGSTPVADKKEIETILSLGEAVKADENCATSPNQVSQAENTSVTARQECATEIEEAAECDVEDPLAMLGGMGEEEVYKVTLIDESTKEGSTPVVETLTSNAVEQEETAECDVEDPLAMLGGMGEEEVYKVTLIDESPKEESIPVVETLTCNAVEQEEPAECDVEDALAMLGGMGEEEVYKVTLMNESTRLLVETLTSNAVEQEEAAECDVEDPLAMLGGMGEEEVYKVTLMDESPQESRSDVVVDSPKEQNKSFVEVEKKKEGASSPKRSKQVAAETESKSKQTARRAKQQENKKSKKR